MKVLRELLADRIVVKNRLRPTFTGAENISVRESTACDQAAKLVQAHAPGKKVRHVNVVGIETRAVEGRSHLPLAVDTLFAKDRDLRTPVTRPGLGILQVEREARVQARVLLV